MKNLIFGLIACLFINFVGNSQEILTVNTVGDFHNLQMENYYKSLEKIVIQKGYNNMTKEDFCSVFKYLTNEVFGKENSKLVLETNSNFAKYFDLKLEDNINTSIDLIKKSTYNNEDLKYFLINLILESKNVEFDNAANFFNIKLNDANKKFKDKDLEIALISINTGKSSFLYWEENLENWNSLFKLNSLSAKAVKPGKTIGAADIGGATAGALYGAYGGTAFLPGVGTVTGALAVGCAGGMYASIGAGAGALFMSLFD